MQFGASGITHERQPNFWHRKKPPEKSSEVNLQLHHALRAGGVIKFTQQPTSIAVINNTETYRQDVS